jgi:hypothetical protein
MENELEVITHAKRLTEYMYTVVCDAPKKYRWNIVDEMHRRTIELLDLLYLTNTLPKDSREKIQREIDAKLKSLSYLILTAKDLKIFNNYQAQTFGRHLLHVKKTLWAWIKSGTKP